MVDYLFGRGVSRALPREEMRLVYSRRSGRVKLVFHGKDLFATVRPNGSMALSLNAASILSAARPFLENCVTVKDDAVPFVRGGKSVFCKFVAKAGSRVAPKGEVAILDTSGKVIGVGRATINGAHMPHFNSGVAVKVREGLQG
jgi:predicted RNA-binding protein (TIGR00451 family)